MENLKSNEIKKGPAPERWMLFLPRLVPAHSPLARSAPRTPAVQYFSIHSKCIILFPSWLTI